MNNILPLSFEDHQVRAIISHNPEGQSEQWIAADVCTALGIRNASQALDALDADEKGICITDTLGGPQQFLVVTEPGLYKLIMRSRKPSAKKFARWVAHEVLPTIRRTGQYGQGTAALQQVATQLGQVVHALKEQQELGLAQIRREMREGFAAQDQVIETRLQEQLPLALKNAPAGTAKIDKTQQEILKNFLVAARKRQEVNFQVVHGRLRAHLSVSSYRNIHNEQFSDALAFLQLEASKGPKTTEQKIFDEAMGGARLQLVAPQSQASHSGHTSKP